MIVIEDEERKTYYEAFSAFDWNNNGKISYGSLQVSQSSSENPVAALSSLSLKWATSYIAACLALIFSFKSFLRL